MTDLWPNDLAIVNARSPATILREQAALLGKKTKNIVIAGVRTANVAARSDKPFNYNFVITSPVIGNYAYRLFTICYDIHLYPVNFMLDDDIAREIGAGQREELIASGKEEFVELLSRILGSEKTRQVIRAILSHATDVTLEDDASS